MEMQGEQADETLFFPVSRCAHIRLPSWGVSARRRSTAECLSGPDQSNTEDCRATDSTYCPTTPGAGCLISLHLLLCVCVWVWVCVFSGAGPGTASGQ